MSAADLPDTIRWQQDDDGIVVLVLDDPLQGANTMNDAYLASMGRTVERLVETKTEVRGVILTSAKKTFFAGGDLNEILTMDHGEAAVVLDRLRRIRYQLRTLETLGIPVVAAIAGAALGGGLEIAMSAHHRIALADRGVQLGYPEVTLGLLPGAGGVVRTVRLLGIAPALSELLLDGRRVEPAVGMELGIIDELVTAEEDLLPTAKRWIAANPRPAQPWDVDGFELPVGGLDQLAAEGVLLTLAAELRRRDPGGNYPAPRQIFAVAVEGAELEFDDASEIEARGFVSLATGQIAKNMIGAYFFDQQQVRSIKAGDGSERPPRLRGVELVGGGDARGHLADVFAGRGLEILRSAATNDPSLARIAIDRTLDSDREAAHAAGVTTLLVSAPGPVDPGAVGEAQLRFLGELESTPLIEVADRRRNSVAALNLALGVAKSLGKTAILTTREPRMLILPMLSAVLTEKERMRDEGISGATVERAIAGAGFSAPALVGSPQAGSSASEPEAAEMPAGVDMEELRLRLLFAPAIVAARLLAEKSVESAAEVNIASILGVGYPGWTGGALRFIDGHEGGREGFVKRARQLADRYGSHFDPPPSLLVPGRS